MIHDFGRNISKDEMNVLPEAKQNEILKIFKVFNVPNSNIKSISLQSKYKDLYKTSEPSPSTSKKEKQTKRRKRAYLE